MTVVILEDAAEYQCAAPNSREPPCLPVHPVTFTP